MRKCVCKHVGKIDEKNCVVVHVDRKRQLVTKYQSLRSTEITASKLMKMSFVQIKEISVIHKEGRLVWIKWYVC